MNQHTSPCAECPFKRTAAPGWLGASTPQEFMGQCQNELRMPCHMLVDYDRKDWQAQAAAAPQCAGRAIFFSNQAKVARDHSLLFLRANHSVVFSTPQEFLAHHTKRLSV